MTRRRPEEFLDWRPAAPPAAPCEHAGCAAAGEFKAPKSRDPRDGYWRFCLEHVRAYNAQWDFFAGMSAAEIEAYQRRDSTWHRPTWKLGAKPEQAPAEDLWSVDDLGILSDLGYRSARPGQAAARNAPPEEREALKTLGMTASATLAEIKSRYKELAKKYHPDRSGGDKDAEERFKQINRAYSYLMTCGYT